MLFQKDIIIEARDSFLKLFDRKPDAAVVLGSGLSGAVQDFDIIKEISFSEINNLKTSNVEGHKNKFVIAGSGDKIILFMVGRVHMYEGFSPFEVSLPVCLSGELGIKDIIITNAAGGINRKFHAGDIMMITDHINMQAGSPLAGIKDSTKFIDMSHAYDKEMLGRLQKKFNIRPGVYIGVPGPNYETPAEIGFFRKAGSDAVGMSTVMETIAAKYYRMRVFGLSLITNMASGIQNNLSHTDVVETGKAGGERMRSVIKYIIDNIG